jgi:hypothetical protein
MDFNSFLWAITLAVFGFSGGGAYGVLGMSPARYNLARVLFVVCGMSIGAMAVLFGMTIPVSTIARLVVTGALGATAAIVIVESWRWVARIGTIGAAPSHTGILVPRSDIVFSTTEGSKITKMQIGESDVYFVGEEGPGKLILPMLRETQFTIEKIDSRMLFSTQITNQDGNFIVEIIKNEWKVAPPPGTWDRNYTTDSLEVIDPQGQVVLQVKVLNDLIRIQGSWWIDRGPPDVIVKVTLWAAPPAGAQLVLTPKNSKQPPPSIPRVFSYPSERHLGELARGAGR